jgi:ComF family protein
MAEWAGRIKAIGAAALAAPARVLFPPLCAGCGRQVQQPTSLCGVCWPRLRLLEPPWCAVFGTPFDHDMGEGFLSAEAIANPPPFQRARAAVAYTGVARQMVQRLKYQDRTDLAPWMAKWMVRAGFELFPDTDIIVPVPLHRRRFFQRRFNQSAELARHIADLTGLPFEPLGVIRVKKTRQQVGLGHREREENVRAAFVVPKEARGKVRGRRILVVDDVYTTGATVVAMTRALQKGGAQAVDVLTFARVLAEDFMTDL